LTTMTTLCTSSRVNTIALSADTVQSSFNPLIKANTLKTN
jgi:hypothetical protein